MSPRAACRLETLGFEEVYDYVPGKVDWLARGLPTEGEKAGEPRAGSAARDDVVRCGPQEVVEEVRQRVQRSPYGFALVVAGGEIVLGRLGSAALEGEPRATAEAAMDPGPSTVRMDMPLVDLDDRLDRRGLTTAVVTTPDGRLTGIVRRSDLTEQLEAASSARERWRSMNPDRGGICRGPGLAVIIVLADGDEVGPMPSAGQEARHLRAGHSCLAPALGGPAGGRLPAPRSAAPPEG